MKYLAIFSLLISYPYFSFSQSLFELKSAKHCNIYADSSTSQSLLFDDKLASPEGGGVAIGDLNNDGLEDIVIINRMWDNTNSFDPRINNGIRVYLNQGNLTFKDITLSTKLFITDFIASIKLVDINQDGFLDIYFCRAAQAHPLNLTSPPSSNSVALLSSPKTKENGISNAKKNYSPLVIHTTPALIAEILSLLPETTTLTAENFHIKEVPKDILNIAINNLLKQERNKPKTTSISQQEVPSPLENTSFLDTPNLLFINQGNLTFKESAKEYGIDDPNHSIDASFFDMNNDGLLDLYIVNQPNQYSDRMKITKALQKNKYYGNDHLYLNTGNNKFINISESAGILQENGYGLSVTTSDINQDGLMDIFVANDYVYNDFLYINQGNNRFKEESKTRLSHISIFSMGSDIADINNDALPDILVVDMLPRQLNKYKAFFSVASIDYNNMLKKNGLHFQFMRNMLHLNNGNGGFNEIGLLTDIAATDWSWAPLMIDFDNDGYKDIFISNSMPRSLLDLNIMMYKAPNVKLSIDSTKQSRKTLVNKQLPNYVFKNNGGLNFSDETQKWGLRPSVNSNGTAYGDLDNDGDLDLIINNADSIPFLYENKANELPNTNYIQFQFEHQYNTGTKIYLYNSQGVQYWEMTNSRGFISTSQAIAHFGLGATTQVDSVVIVWQDLDKQLIINPKINTAHKILKQKTGQKYQFEIAKNELFEELDLTKQLDYKHQENQFNDLKRNPLLHQFYSRNGPCLSVGDVNNDGLEDVFVGGAKGQSGQIYLQEHQGFKLDKSLLSDSNKESEDVASLFFDYDGDKDLDLYVVSGGSEFNQGNTLLTDRLYANDGKGNFSLTTNVIPQLSSYGSCVKAADFDADGDMDLFIGGRVDFRDYPKAPRSYILVNHKGKFIDKTDKIAPRLSNIGMVTDAEWADYNGDKKLDLILVGEWMPLTVFEQTKKGFTNKTKDLGLSKTNGWWNTLSLSDLDKDGDLDIVGGNWGLNNKIKASIEQPMKIYYDDFDANGSMDPVFCMYDQDVLQVIHRHDKIMDQIPSLRRKFPKVRRYAYASLEEVFDKEQLDKAGMLEVFDFRTCWFENKEGKEFIKHELPIQAQFAPVNAILTDDINKDGHMDILLSGNNFYVEAEVGRYDALHGVVLLGDSKGNFKNIPNGKSGFYTPNFVRDMKFIDLKNLGKCVLVGNNDDVLQLFSFKKK